MSALDGLHVSLEPARALKKNTKRPLYDRILVAARSLFVQRVMTAQP